MHTNHGQSLFAVERGGTTKSIREVELELQKIRLEAEAVRLEARATELLLWLEQVARGVPSEPPSVIQMPSGTSTPDASHSDVWEQREMQAWRRLAESRWCQDLLTGLTPLAADVGLHEPLSPQANPCAPSPFSTPLNTTPLNTTPLNTTPLNTTPLNTTPLNTTPLNTTPLNTTPLNTTPLNTTPLNTTPLNTTPLNTTPLNTTPLNTTPLNTTPLNTTPLNTTPLNTTPLNTTPLNDKSLRDKSVTKPKRIERPENPLSKTNRPKANKQKKVSLSRKTRPIEIRGITKSFVEKFHPKHTSRATLISGLAHGGLVFGLALMTFVVDEPKDVLIVNAVSTSAESESVESVTIESVAAPSVESVASVSEAVSQEVSINPSTTDALSPAAALTAAGQLEPNARDSLAAAFQDAQSAASNARVSGPKSDANSTIFYGVGGGGSRLCFIVDNSSSMSRGRFESARGELLRTLDTLGADKRFYVIFYNQNLSPMCLEGTAPAEHLTFASDESKRAVRNWAMTVGLDRGAPPDEALRWAFNLEPEVIYLLTDGEFPDHTEKLMRELNHRENLFGSNTRRCIIHTIAFHSEVGVERLKRIASSHGGKFRYIPPP